MKKMIGALLIGLFLSVSTGAYRPSLTSLSDFDANVLLYEVGVAIEYCMSADERLFAFYHDFMSSNKTVRFFKSLLPPDQKPGTIVLLGFGLVALWGYSRRSMKRK
jgi:hypothetical protein